MRCAVRFSNLKLEPSQRRHGAPGRRAAFEVKQTQLDIQSVIAGTAYRGDLSSACTATVNFAPKPFAMTSDITLLTGLTFANMAVALRVVMKHGWQLNICPFDTPKATRGVVRGPWGSIPSPDRLFSRK